MSQCFYACYCELSEYVTYYEFALAQVLDEFSRGVSTRSAQRSHISFTCVLQNKFSQAMFLRANVHIRADCFDTMQICFCFIIPCVCFLNVCSAFFGRCLPQACLTLICRSTKTHTQTNFLQGTSKLKSGDKWHRICVLLVRLYKDLTLNILNV